MLNFCTIFNSAYLSRGLALYRSLERCASGFHLYIFAMDDDCLKVLRSMNLKDATVISLSEFEDSELLRVKPTRTSGEYCWTCTPSSILYSITKFSLDHCTYLDADMLFFSDPHVLIEEMGDQSILLTEHRYSEEYARKINTEEGGRYCVQFVTFKRTEDGLAALKWWREACIEWCYNRREDNKFGDQKYLDDWKTRFKGVHELEHLGGGIAPWNVSQYVFEKRNGKLYGRDASGVQFETVFYHFHHLNYNVSDIFCLSAFYKFTANAISNIYKPYIRALSEAEREIKSVNSFLASHESLPVPWLNKSAGRTLLLHLTGHYKNYYKRSYFLS